MKLPKNNYSISGLLLVALLISMIELPEFAPHFLTYCTPDWALLVCFCWATNPSLRISIVVPWGFGFLFDALNAEPLGLNGFIYSIVVFVGLNLPTRSNRPIIGYQLSALVVLVLLSEVTRKVALLFVEFPLKFSIVGSLWAVVATLAGWYLVVLVVDRLIEKDESQVSFT